MPGHSGRRGATCALAACLAACLVVGLVVAPAVEPVAAASPAPSLSAVGERAGTHPSVSGDGRFVVHQGPPAPPADADPRASTIWFTDLVDGASVELTSLGAGVRPGESVRPVVSGDGCVVVILTEMPLDLFRDDDDGARWDVYRTRLPHCEGALGEWELVSAGPDGLARNDVATDPPAVSRSGALVAYTHRASQFADTADLTTVSLVDLTVPVDAPQRTVGVQGMPAAPPDSVFVQRGIDQPALSGDGRFLAYRSDAASNEAVPRWGEGPEPGADALAQVYVWDREEADPFAAVRLVSGVDGRPSTSGAEQPVLSLDGRAVAFTSVDTGLVDADPPPCADTCPTQVFHLDRDTDGNGLLDEPGGWALTVVSAVPGTSPLEVGTASSSQPTLSADGRLVGYVTKSSNLLPAPVASGGEPDVGHVLVADTGTATLRPAADPTTTEIGVGVHAHPDLDDTGRTVVYDTLRLEAPESEAPGADRRINAAVAPPRLSLPDAELGTTLVGRESDEWYVAVVNDGPSTFAPFSVTISDDRFSVDEEASTCVPGNTVPPGGDCTVRLSFTPDRPGPVEATLEVAELGYGAVSVSARISGSGGEPALRIEPAGTDLGTVDIGSSSAEFQFDVTNLSVLATSVASAFVTGADAGDFAVTTNNCAGRPLNPRAACSIGVVFTPTEPGRRTALVEVVTPAGTTTSFLVAGDGRFAPTVIVATDSVAAGGATIAGGGGFPPRTEVTLTFGDGASDRISTVTNDEGNFLVDLPVRSDERRGRREIVVQANGGVTASTSIEVVGGTRPMIGMPGFGLGVPRIGG